VLRHLRRPPVSAAFPERPVRTPRCLRRGPRTALFALEQIARDADADGHADRVADGDVDSHGYADRVADVDIDSHGDADRIADGDIGRYGHADCIADVDIDRYGHADCIADVDIDRYGHADCVADGDIDRYGRADCIADCDVDSHGHANRVANGDVDSHGHADCNADGHADATPTSTTVDHYKVYSLFPDPPPAAPVHMEDQFGAGPVTLTSLAKLGVPVSKAIAPNPPAPLPGGLIRPVEHLTWYEFFEPQPPRIARLKNQFTSENKGALWSVTDGHFLLVPAIKDFVGPIELGQHWKCYDANLRATTQTCVSRNPRVELFRM